MSYTGSKSIISNPFWTVRFAYVLINRISHRTTAWNFCSRYVQVVHPVMKFIWITFSNNFTIRYHFISSNAGTRCYVVFRNPSHWWVIEVFFICSFCLGMPPWCLLFVLVKGSAVTPSAIKGRASAPTIAFMDGRHEGSGLKFLGLRRGTASRLTFSNFDDLGS